MGQFCGVRDGLHLSGKGAAVLADGLNRQLAVDWVTCAI